MILLNIDWLPFNFQHTLLVDRIAGSREFRHRLLRGRCHRHCLLAESEKLDLEIPIQASDELIFDICESIGNDEHRVNDE